MKGPMACFNLLFAEWQQSAVCFRKIEDGPCPKEFIVQFRQENYSSFPNLMWVFHGVSSSVWEVVE